MTRIERPCDENGECSPAKPKTGRRGYAEASVRDWASDWQKRWGHGKAGMESEEGTALSSFLGPSRVGERIPLVDTY